MKIAFIHFVSPFIHRSFILSSFIKKAIDSPDNYDQELDQDESSE